MESSGLDVWQQRSFEVEKRKQLEQCVNQISSCPLLHALQICAELHGYCYKFQYVALKDSGI